MVARTAVVAVLRSATLAALLVPAAPTVLAAQAVGPVSGASLVAPEPAWLSRWSALADLADLPRELPFADAALPRLVNVPAPRAGLLWSAGNPAGLPFEVDSSRVEFRILLSSAEGDYRRPLDAGAETRQEVAASGWRRVGQRGASIGRAAFQTAEFDRAVFANVHSPFGTNPHVIVDTSGTALDRTAAALEGAIGWEIAGFGIGAALAYEAGDTRTVASPVPRSIIRSVTGVRVGVARPIGTHGLRIGAHGRWQVGAERVRLWAVGAGTQLFHLEGYNEPRSQNLSTFYFRRLERSGTAAGVSAAGRVRDADWAVFGELARAEEDHFAERRSSPVTDRWSADARTLGFALHRSPAHGLGAGIDLRWTRLDGDAERALDDAPVSFTAGESLLQSAIDVRWTTHAWQASGRIHLVHGDRTRRDLSVGARSEIDGLQVGGGIALAHTVAEKLRVGIALAGTGYAPVGGMPDPSGLGPVYARFIAPELAVSGTNARARAASVDAAWSWTPGRRVWLRVLHSNLSPSTGGVSLPHLPAGKRSGWSVGTGVSLGGDEAR